MAVEDGDFVSPALRTARPGTRRLNHDPSQGTYSDSSIIYGKEKFITYCECGLNEYLGNLKTKVFFV